MSALSHWTQLGLTIHFRITSSNLSAITTHGSLAYLLGIPLSRKEMPRSSSAMGDCSVSHCKFDEHRTSSCGLAWGPG